MKLMFIESIFVLLIIGVITTISTYIYFRFGEIYGRLSVSLGLLLRAFILYIYNKYQQ